MGEEVRSARSLLTNFVYTLKRFIFLNEWALFFILLTPLFSSCTNIAKSKSTLSTLNNLVAPAEGTNASSFQLVTVIPSQAIIGDYDLIGSSGEFDSYCQDTHNPNSKCKCAFTYDQPGVGTQTVQTSIVYQESNLVRCTNQVPSGISSFNISVVTIDGSSSSNTQTVTLSSGVFSNSTSYLDLASSNSYLQAQRFQCRKREQISNPLDPNLVDPFQSENPTLLYPFNYYTTNVSDSLLQLQQKKGVSWECTLATTQTGALQWWANPYVFSAETCTSAFCMGDGELIAPTDSLVSGKIASATSTTNPNGKRRSSFSLAKQSYGVFQVPVQAAVAPNDYVSATYGVIGYAAQAVPSSNGVSSCPNITLPPKATWVKLWNFRATSITPPSMLTTSTSMSQSGIACDPGVGAFPACAAQTSTVTAFDAQGTYTPSGLGHTINATPLNALGTLAARVVLLTSSGGTGSPADSCSIIDNSLWAVGEASEVWQPGFFGFEPTSFPLSQIQSLPWGLYANLPAGTVQSPFTPAVASATPTYFLSTGAGGVPPIQIIPEVSPSDFTPNVTTSNVSGSSNNYTDQIFVVTETGVNDTNMKNSVNTYYPYYLPQTYRSASDCSANSKATCSGNDSKKINWNLSTQAVGKSAVGADVYPLCVVQFYD